MMTGQRVSQGMMLRLAPLMAPKTSAPPLSDSAIRERLRSAQSLDIALRTVNKYRKQLRIPDSRARRATDSASPSACGSIAPERRRAM